MRPVARQDHFLGKRRHIATTVSATPYDGIVRRFQWHSTLDVGRNRTKECDVIASLGGGAGAGAAGRQRGSFGGWGEGRGEEIQNQEVQHGVLRY